jgi:hypothetical protein
LQVRTRKVLLPAVMEITGWFVAAVAGNGELLRPTQVRFATGAVLGTLLNVAMELRSRKRFLAGLRHTSACRAQGTLAKGGSSSAAWLSGQSSGGMCEKQEEKEA